MAGFCKTEKDYHDAAMKALKEKKIGLTDYVTLTCILYYRNGDTGLCHPSRETLAANRGVVVRTIDKSLEVLRAAGLITSVRGGRIAGGVKVANIYKFTIPTDAGKVDIDNGELINPADEVEEKDEKEDVIEDIPVVVEEPAEKYNEERVQSAYMDIVRNKGRGLNNIAGLTEAERTTAEERWVDKQVNNYKQQGQKKSRKLILDILATVHLEKYIDRFNDVLID